MNQVFELAASRRFRRQGDLVLTPAMLPDGAVRSEDRTVQKGGHSHRLTKGDLYTHQGKRYLVPVDGEFELTHGTVGGEHRPLRGTEVMRVVNLSQYLGDSWSPVRD